MLPEMKLHVVKSGQDVKLTLMSRAGKAHCITLPEYAWLSMVGEMTKRAAEFGGLSIDGDAACMKAMKKADVLLEVEGKDTQAPIKIRRSTLEMIDFVAIGVALQRGKRLTRSGFMDELITLGMEHIGSK